jgi:DNA-binding MarR family transcriptional regulator
MRDITIDYMLRHTWQNIAKMYNDEANKYGATMSIGFALLSIDKEEGTPSSAISHRMGMEPSSLTRTLKTLEDKGLIYREKNPEDGRGVMIHLTDFGKEKRELSKQTVLKFNQSVKENVEENDLQTFFKVTETINKLIQDKQIFNQTHLYEQQEN